MSVRVVARIRPLSKAEIDKDIILTTAGEAPTGKTTVSLPNPKCQAETYSFQFNSVYDKDATQAQVFDNEVAPTIKQLFKGCDVTIFAYGVTGTGKTHTMRGGKSLQDRGVIPRLLSSIYRKARKIEKDTDGQTEVEVVMSYYEIYNDKVFDLFEPPEKRTPAGLAIRDNNGKTVVVGLTERPCSSLKEFEHLYDEANVNRSTSATKLNAHSSRSHAILCVKIVQTIGDQSRVSTASAIDLAGSEDNRRTDNNKERLVESASINKSLFVLAQGVEAISKKHARIPYRESKMTRILSLGQNDGITVMILNLAPVRSYHLDTLSSLNFANRTKKIEVNEVENQPFFRDPPTKGKQDFATSREVPSIYRQPLRPKLLPQNSHLKDITSNVPKPARQFSVYSDKNRTSTKPFAPPKAFRPNEMPTGLSKDAIEALIDRKVSEALAERVDSTTVSQGDAISDDMQKRLEALEKRIEGQESERAEGLQYLLMAKQHQLRGEDVSALRMYQLALPHFPENEKLARKVARLQDKIAAKRLVPSPSVARLRHDAETVCELEVGHAKHRTEKRKRSMQEDESYHDIQDEAKSYEEDDDFVYRPRTKIRRPQNSRLERPLIAPTLAPTIDPYEPTAEHARFPNEHETDDEFTTPTCLTPRTKHLLGVINSRDVGQIRMLRGVGAKKAESIVNCLCDLKDEAGVTSLNQLSKLKGVGCKTVESMRNGLLV